MSPEFENQLQRQPLRELPPGWRAQILAAAAGSEGASFRARLSAWFWPYQRGWAALAAAWIAIFLFLFTTPDEPRLAANSYGQSRPSIAIIQQRALIVAQLLGSLENDNPSPALPATPKPRSERPGTQLAG